MTRTIKREPFSVSIPKSQSGFLNLIGFKGLCDNQNDVAIEQTTFAEGKNVYVDTNDCLSSRPPMKFNDGEAHILKEWHFGPYGLRLYGFWVDDNNNVVKDMTLATHVLYLLRCYTHSCFSGTIDGKRMYNKYAWKMPADYKFMEYIPKVSMKQIEDKIFIWFASRDFICFNTAGRVILGSNMILPYFEDAKPYLYMPVRKLITNGLESDLETENYLTDSYKKRYLQSTLSSIDFHKLLGKTLEVTLTNGQGSKYLYDVTVDKYSDKTLIYPVSPIGEGYEIDVVRGLRTDVYLRYDKITKGVEVSFDGKYFQPLPILDNIIGTPQLTKDGLWVIAFTTTGLAKCKLVAEEADDFTDSSEILVWQVEPYLRLARRDGLPMYLNTIDTATIPTGYFETAYNFMYVLRGPNIDAGTTDTISYCYAEWAGEQGKTLWGIQTLSSSFDFEFRSENDVKTAFKYIAPTVYSPNLGPIASMLYKSSAQSAKVVVVQFNSNTRNEFEIKNNDLIGVAEIKSYAGKSFTYDTIKPQPSNNYNAGYIHKLSGDGKRLAQGTIMSGDVVYFGRAPLGLGAIKDFSSTRTYLPGDYVISYVSSGGYDIPYIFVCTTESTGHLPSSAGVDNTWWHVISSCYVANHNGYRSFVEIAAQELTNVPFIIGGVSFGNTNRYVITNSTGGAIKPGDTISLTPYEMNIIYTATEMDEIFGQVPVGRNANGELDPSPVGWSYFLVNSSKSKPTQEFNGLAAVAYLNNATVSKYTESSSFSVAIAAKNTDMIIQASSGDYEGTLNSILVAARNATQDVLDTITYNRKNNSTVIQYSTLTDKSERFKLSPDGSLILTDKCLYVNKIAVDIPMLGTDVKPLLVGNDIWLYIDGDIWTSATTVDNTLELDEYVDTDGKIAILNEAIPEYFAELEEVYMSFVDIDTAKNLLQITQTKRDERKVIAQESADFLLYLPKKNEQVMSNKITNLHPLYEKVVGIFTEEEIYYINTITLSDGTITYSKPIKSKLPVGCRDGSDVITAMNGQMIVFTTPRGVAALSPQDFVATTEQTITYLSANIENMYNDFFDGTVINVNVAPQAGWTGLGKPNIKIVIYRYWVLFYRYYDRDVLMFDMRYNSWWHLEMPYPIKYMHAADNLTMILEIDESVINDSTTGKPVVAPLYGVSYLFSDRAKYKYYKDDIVDDSLNGDYNKVPVLPAPPYMQDTLYIAELVTDKISWHFKSQKLHFNQPNYYKLIKAINMSARGNDDMVAELSTIAYRDYYHPEQSDIMELKVNDIRTFIKRMNLMHVVYFQFKIKSDDTQEYPVPLELNSVSVKYEIKEMVR